MGNLWKNLQKFKIWFAYQIKSLSHQNQSSSDGCVLLIYVWVEYACMCDVFKSTKLNIIIQIFNRV